MMTENCPIENTIKLINGKWKSVIIYRLCKYRICRFSELQKLIPGCSKRMLALQLKELEKDGIVNKKVYDIVPPKTEYSLTALGRTLQPIVESMNQFGKKISKKV